MADAHDALLGAHVVAGVAGLLLGPLAIRVERHGPHTSRAGFGYVCAVLLVSLTALGLIVIDPATLWWLAPLSFLAAGLAALGRLAPRWRGRQWVRAYAHGQGGSYIALCTATLVVSVSDRMQVLAWTAPTIVGLVLIERRVSRLAARSSGET